MPGMNPPAFLVPRERDEKLTAQELEHVALFAELSSQPDFTDYPGSMVLRHFRRGDVVCRQDEPGWTAFYILTTKDLVELRESQLSRAAVDRAQQLRTEASTLRHRLTQEDGTPRDVMTVTIDVPGVAGPGQSGLWKHLRLPWRNGGKQQPTVQRATLAEGELFGEMSCLYRTPRSATVIAAEDCYALEMLRNLLDSMYTNRNRAFKDKIDSNYRRRVLDGHLRHLPLFRDVGEDVLHHLKEQAELLNFEPGDLICDEHDRADAMFVVRSGFVRVIKNASYLLSDSAVCSWPGLCKLLGTASQEAPPGPRRAVWDLLPEPLRARVTQAPDELTNEDKLQLCAAVNDIVKQPKLAAAAPFKETVGAAGWGDELKKLPGTPKKWAQHQQVCAFNRRLLETLFPGAIVPYASVAGMTRTLAYASVGDLIGEMGLVLGRPRSATCIAYDHGDYKFGRVEAVRISKDLFEQLTKTSPALAERVSALAESRLGTSEKLPEGYSWEAKEPAALSERFHELGLIQGQKLMLIDLDRCTRCDLCVRACVDTHDDGRSRLFLDGPRFRVPEGDAVKTYLVPATCRQCKDPVCLINCPVGSIHKGSNGQVVIEDWCIGCRRCAMQCPYGAIQMHAIGIVPRGAASWRYRPTPDSTECQPWYAPRFSDRSWFTAAAPFSYNRDLRERLGLSVNSPPAELQFRLAFDLRGEDAEGARSFHLQVLSKSPSVAIWVNGEEIVSNADGAKTKAKQDKQEEWNIEALLAVKETARAGTRPAPPERSGDEPFPRAILRIGMNLVAIRAALPCRRVTCLWTRGFTRCKSRLSPARLADTAAQALVMNQAVVCDMCSEQFGQRPACVNACPHDAAMRVVATQKFALR